MMSNLITLLTQEKKSRSNNISNKQITTVSKIKFREENGSALRRCTATQTHFPSQMSWWWSKQKAILQIGWILKHKSHRSVTLCLNSTTQGMKAKSSNRHTSIPQICWENENWRKFSQNMRELVEIFRTSKQQCFEFWQHLSMPL